MTDSNNEASQPLPLHDSQSQSVQMSQTLPLSQPPLCTPVDQVIAARSQPPSQHPPSPLRPTVAKRRRLHHHPANSSRPPNAGATNNRSNPSTNRPNSNPTSSALSFLRTVDNMDASSLDNYLPSATDDDSSSLHLQSASCSQQLPQFSQDTLALLPSIVRDHQQSRRPASARHQQQHGGTTNNGNNNNTALHLFSSQPLSQPLPSTSGDYQQRLVRTPSASREPASPSKVKRRRHHSDTERRSDARLLRASIASAVTSAEPVLNPFLPGAAQTFRSRSMPATRRASSASDSFQDLGSVVPGPRRRSLPAPPAADPEPEDSDPYPQFGARAASVRKRAMKMLLVSSAQGRARKSADFDMEAVAGRGAFSEVWRATFRTDGCAYAVKKNRIAMLSDTARLLALHEVLALAALQGHPNILRYFDAWFEDRGHFLYVQTELLARGNLHERHVATSRPLSPDSLFTLARDISSALDHMHSRGIAHVDVKPDNIFQRDRAGAYVLGDFGLACNRYGYGTSTTEGDSRYLCPEALSLGPTTAAQCRDLCAGDVFSLGASLYELALGKPLDKAGPAWARLRKFPDEALDAVAERTGSRRLATLVRMCLEPDPTRRARAVDIKRLATEEDAEKESLKKQLREAKDRLTRFEAVVAGLLKKGEEGRVQYKARYASSSGSQTGCQAAESTDCVKQFVNA